MDAVHRRELVKRALPGYASGPDAPVRATAEALARVDGATVAVLVEGVSDQIAVETAATVGGRDLADRRVVVVPIGGAHAIGRFVATLGPRGAGLRLAGLCDGNEAELFRRALLRAGVGSPRDDLERLGFFVCERDLEDELIRAVGAARTQALLGVHGDLGAFRSFQAQPAWRGRAPEAQLRRFLGSGASRKLRYAQLLTEAATRQGTLPPPLEALLATVDAYSGRTTTSGPSSDVGTSKPSR
jgi:hypothetical protein